MKIGFLLVARLKSTRLPYKVMLDLNGKTVLEREINRIKQIKGLDTIVVCTSTNPQDRPIIDTAKDNNVYYFSGDGKDVVKRLVTAAKLHNIDYFVTITADDPLFSVRYANRVVDELKTGKYDYVKISGLPLGTDVYGISTVAIETILKVKTVINTEYWKYLIDKSEIFNIKEIQSIYNSENVRLTLDYEEDYELINFLYNKIEFKNYLPLRKVMERLNDNSTLKNINKDCKQKKVSPALKRMIDEDFKKNKDKILRIKKELKENE